MNDFVTWMAVIGAGGGGSVIAFITFWMALSTRITNAEATSKHAENQVIQLTKNCESTAQGARELAQAAIAKCEFIVRDISTDRVHTASKLAALESITETNSKALVAAETRLARSIEDVSQKIDKLSETLLRTFSDMLQNQQK